MRLTIPLLFLCLFGASFAKAQSRSIPTIPTKDTSSKTRIAKTDTAAKKKAIQLPYVHQFRIGLDLASIATSVLYSDKDVVEVQLDYKLRKTNYLVLETGYGKNNVNYDNLKYSNSNGYIRLGIDKNVLDVLSPKDFDIFFIGVRLGMGLGSRSDATFLVPSYFGPTTEGDKPSKSYFLYWGEINAGMRVELLKNFFMGWNVRLKVLFNSGVFTELAPSYVPGYGHGDKATNLGANIYMAYALRWTK